MTLVLFITVNIPTEEWILRSEGHAYLRGTLAHIFWSGADVYYIILKLVAYS